TIPGLIVLFGPDGSTQAANQQMLDYVGLEFEDFKDWATNGVSHSDDIAHSVATFSRSLATGEPYDFETRLRRHDGSYRWFKIRGQPIKDEVGSIVRWYGLLTDIDDQKRAEQALRESEQSARDIVDNIPGMISLLKPGGGLEFLNKQILDYTGMEPDE